ncbi:Mur ligase family protein [Methanobacterium alcaliphilum]|uniref:Mur ligase family protein n=1 Tax=Methanobacterium alcaliphilum TaxID=392018 RepID=UPI00200A1E2C|nr:Mur ligase family protein [Methanobacterium alcaliphilum]MCK9151692.1 Mur ligase family protein [Methanobacterium alcaliphilum]
MKVAVIGLGVEGKKAVKSLQEHKCEVYATDLNENIQLESGDELDLDLDLGRHDFDKIFSSDAVVLSPSLWESDLAQKLIESKKLLSDVIGGNRSIFTIAVTGTNGKTTTSFMIRDILKNAGLNVLLGGNAGGGFDGYTEMILESEVNSYDVLVVEVCDMTMGFCDYNFQFDLVVVTNLGRDHLDYHGSLDEYLQRVGKFLKGKRAILNKTDNLLQKVSKNAEICEFYGECDYSTHLFGKFNKYNAGAAEAVSKALQIDDQIIKDTLENFNAIEGRIKSYNIYGSKVVIGKTDNADAISSVLNEMDFPVIFIGTPRPNETWRLEILEEALKANPSLLVVFPGLDSDLEPAMHKLKCLDFQGQLKIAKNTDEILTIILNRAKNGDNVLIGGNGQSTILKIQKKLENTDI